ncbi:MAG: hypothetical protein LUP97_05865 [Methanoregula sp.]|nr:hypothetical protein [Methanoregula sp.]
MRYQGIDRIAMCLLVLIALFVPVASAFGENLPRPLAENSPEIISALKNHIVYVGESQEARMNGIIRYIDLISNGAAKIDLEWIQEDYLTQASSIPLMYTAREINAAREEMGKQSLNFANAAQDQLLFFNGNFNTMKDYVNDSMIALSDSFVSARDPQWLARSGARLAVFNASSSERNTTLSDLARQGIDVTKAREISDQIDSQRTNLENALAHRGDVTIQSVNSDIKFLNQQFRNAVLDYRAQLRIMTSVATVSAMK